MSKTKVKALVMSFLASFVLLTSTVAVHAQGFISPSDNPTAVAGATGGEGSIRQLVLKIVNFALGFLGVIAVIMIIYGGFLYVTAAGADEKIQSAKKIIMYSVIGIIIILLSFAIVNTVLSAGTGVATG